MVNRTWGLLQLHPSEGAYGTNFEYEEFLVMPYSWISVIISCISLLIGWILLNIPPLSDCCSVSPVFIISFRLFGYCKSYSIGNQLTRSTSKSL